MKKLSLFCLVLLAGCASLSRDCSSFKASNFGTDWLIVQYAASDSPINCWKLVNEAVSNEIDGIYWKSSEHLVHISGWYNRVQVENYDPNTRQDKNSDFDGAAKLLGIDLALCNNGAYGVKK